ncbi:MarR family winged helix-turn-helix transcriptional regulator [Rhizomonospora bruguierae]|uniref:MarR family winged helix-turn-helix transcriptional regulator n=1 Tax=Rhizomonospora bruguierae TaxID=1581705 RepID=UPI0020BDFA9C|nr:MarR family transcriptional regulator [Micromonospora sp. NBRC 107566]
MTRQDPAIGAIETEVALLMRRGDAARRVTPVAAHRALDRAAYLLLRRLEQGGPQNVSALAAALHLDGSTVTRQVAALLREGLVSRERDPRDGRGAVIAMTPAGASRLSGVRAAREQLYERILTGWSAEERETLARYLHRLNHAMDEHTRAPGR